MGKNQLGKTNAKQPSKGSARTFLPETNPQPSRIDLINLEGHPSTGKGLAEARGTEPVKGKMGG